MAKKKEPIAKDYKVEFNIPVFLESRFATNMVVQRMGEYFKVSLFEIKPDIILSDKDREAFEKKGSVRADCLASYIISPESMQKFIDAMSGQLGKYKESKEKTEG